MIFSYSVLFIVNEVLGIAKKYFYLFANMTYDIPKNSKKPTHIFVKSGRLSFGISDLNRNSYRSRRGRFFKIPDGAASVSFPEYEFRKCNNYYGFPEWLNTNNEAIDVGYTEII